MQARTVCAPARTGKALCLSYPCDHSNLRAEANESRSWGWEAFASFSAGESPAGVFTEAWVWGEYTGESWFPRSKTITGEVYAGAMFQNTMCMVGRKQGAVSKNLCLCVPLRGQILSLLGQNLSPFR